MSGINGQALYFDQALILQQGSVLVPMRAIFEAFGSHVEWNAQTQTVIAKKKSLTV
ncbi:stalk domain-containing protein [Paenibacillus sp. PvR148]